MAAFEPEPKPNIREKAHHSSLLTPRFLSHEPITEIDWSMRHSYNHLHDKFVTTKYQLAICREGKYSLRDITKLQNPLDPDSLSSPTFFFSSPSAKQGRRRRPDPDISDLPATASETKEEKVMRGRLKNKEDKENTEESLTHSSSQSSQPARRLSVQDRINLFENNQTRRNKVRSGLLGTQLSFGGCRRTQRC
uniref:Uncharacterized protein n=1 Tax=Nelumbo nucifera TaxID=4432 RepID=A0A822ZT80_NELNU|nr:TPA_asm: hypothetical protein HUJ06_019061 [Nelumbo nucifera]